MNIENKKNFLLLQLNENLKLLNKSLDALLLSYNNCKTLNIDEKLTSSGEIEFEAVTARFARTSDILTQKVIRTVFELIQENISTFLDASNLLEKIGIVESSEDIIQVRTLRNTISHEYKVEDIKQIFKEVLKYTPVLVEIIDKTKEYISKKL